MADAAAAVSWHMVFYRLTTCSAIISELFRVHVNIVTCTIEVCRQNIGYPFRIRLASWADWLQRLCWYELWGN